MVRHLVYQLCMLVSDDTVSSDGSLAYLNELAEQSTIRTTARAIKPVWRLKSKSSRLYVSETCLWSTVIPASERKLSGLARVHYLQNRRAKHGHKGRGVCNTNADHRLVMIKSTNY